MVVLTEETQDAETADGVEVIGLAAWLKRGETVTELPEGPKEEDLAAIVYTSGTTGRPKGVMLTHKNVLFDAVACCEHIAPQPMAGGVFLSFLPLSHTFERTAGYYLALGMACTIVYNRSIMLLNEDLRIVKPTVLISVPRVYERIYARINDKLKKPPATRGVFLKPACPWAGATSAAKINCPWNPRFGRFLTASPARF